VDLIDRSTSTNYDIQTAYNDIKILTFADDFLDLKKYLDGRIKESDYVSIGKGEVFSDNIYAVKT